MKIYKWLYNPTSGTIGKALIQVEAGEVADFELMTMIVDGHVGNYGVTIELVADDEKRINLKYDQKLNTYKVYPQFGFPPPGILKDRKRFYKVLVRRD